MIYLIVSLISISVWLYGFVGEYDGYTDLELYRVIGILCLIAYGGPAYYWMRSLLTTNRKKNQMNFIKTLVWLPGILWFLVALGLK